MTTPCVRSEVGICNTALEYLGLDQIVSFNDNTKKARLCYDLYPKERNYQQRLFPWAFCTVRASLALTAITPTYGFLYAFQLPPDFIGIYDMQYPQYPYRIENGLLLTSSGNTFNCRYTSNVQDPTLFDDAFCKALSASLASQMAYSLVQSNELAVAMDKKYQQVMAEARSANAQRSGLPNQLQIDTFLWSRF